MVHARLRYLILSSVSALFWPQLALAQMTPKVVDQSPVDTASGVSQRSIQGAPTSTQSRSDSTQAGLSDIIVTARRRSERLQSVPIAVQAVSGAEFAARGLSRAEDLIQSTPSLRTSPVSGRRTNVSYILRGISSDEGLISQDAAIGIYTDEVYNPRPVGINQQIYDVENIQVLYGPQGTLFGRNSTAGAVLFTSKRPTDRLEGEISATYGNYDRKELRGILNIPLTEDLAIRISGQRLKRDGYTKQILYDNGSPGRITGTRMIDNENISTLRGSVLWNPGKIFENILIGDYFRSSDRGANYKLWAARACHDPNLSSIPASEAFSPTAGPPIGCFYGNTPSAVFGGAPVNVAVGQGLGNYFDQLAQAHADGPRVNRSDVLTYTRSKAYGVANISTLELSDTLTLKNVFGYRHTDYSSIQEGDLTPLSIIEDGPRSGRSNSISDELQLQGRNFDGRLNWIIGLYGFQERGREQLVSIVFPQLQATPRNTINSKANNRSYSAFAQGTFKIIEALSLTAGVRYTIDKKRATQYDSFSDNRAVPGLISCYLADETATPLPLAECTSRSFDKTYRKPTYTLSLDYQLDRDTLFYVAHRQGYRSGGFNIRGTTPSSVGPFKPEVTKDVELGIKRDWRLWDGASARTNIAVYQTRYSNIQRSVAFVNERGVIVGSIVNAADAKINGFEINGAITPTRGLEISGFWGYVDGKYEDFQAIIAGVPVTSSPDFPNSKSTFGVTVTATPIDSDTVGRLALTANFSYQTKSFDDHALPDIEPESKVPGQGLLNLTVDWEHIAGSPVSAQAFVRNVLNKDYIQGNLSLQDVLGWSTRTYGEPRMAGLTLKYMFGARD
jgi:iron complex outermembrane receptor protein